MVGEVTPRRFPPPWTVEELDACFVVTDSARAETVTAWRQTRQDEGKAVSARYAANGFAVEASTPLRTNVRTNGWHAANECWRKHYASKR
jgi:hypothetical protein